MRLRLSRRASRDLDDISLFTAQEWGVEQAIRYEEELNRTLERLKQFPYLGRVDQVRGGGVRSLVVGQHVIVYRVLDDEVNIARVLHVRRESQTDAVD